ncbi:hypothetical protein N7462_007602 [Penicillium macrosclerotiorum]|uniref:uncharacterized protein n=1 Tax=Penicillium macrosclerotiorum TaxID=303699 RepID=UPI002547B629|nr:uncharacterized protein N7462_007602 [Penicillium macrosclerotiorum]KAJ5679358.1 hypothetical protein N7462_007602 [Penicillium macrosclerotiorum]
MLRSMATSYSLRTYTLTLRLAVSSLLFSLMFQRQNRGAGDARPAQPFKRRFASQSPSCDNPDSESVYSDEREIFNAIVVPSASRDSRGYETAYQMGPIMEEGLAANIAMFIPTKSADGSPSPTTHRRGKREGRKLDTVWWRSHILSDQSSDRPRQVSSSPLNETAYTADTSQPQHRKATSLDALDGNSSPLTWPGKPGPAVLPNQPRYPPPERMPTPPGLPSFNTPEAVYCSAQFLSGRSPGQPSSTRFYQRHAAANGERPTSYGDTFRRFLGLSSSPDPRVSTVGIGRADDGTIVQGRFPYRQSGHNMNPARQLQDHPFHGSNLPTADTVPEDVSEAASSKDSGFQLRRRARNYVPPSIGRLWPFPDGHLSSTPNEAPPTRPRAPARACSFLGMPRSSTRQGEFTGGSNSRPEQLSSHVTSTRGNHEPSHHSQLQAVQAIDDESVDDLPSQGIHSLSDILAWLPVQMYVCCLTSSCPFHSISEDPDSLEAVTSRDTYITAPSRPLSSDSQTASSWTDPSHSGQSQLSSWLDAILSRISSYTSSQWSSSVSQQNT